MRQAATLSVVIDTEEEFDWGQPFDRAKTGVGHMAQISRLQHVFERHGVVPAYLATYPVIDQPVGYEPLRALAVAGRAEVGAHLHPWVTPPFVEEVSAYNSYPGNLPRDVEAEKLARLTARLTETIGQRPTIYKAGRYGLGPNTYDLLVEAGYQIDVSPMPPMDFRADGGPDYRDHPAAPVWRGPAGQLLSVPNGGGYAGLLAGMARPLQAISESPAGRAFRLPGLLWRLRLLQRIRLSPEGFSATDMLHLARAMIGRKEHHLVLSLHSPSIEPGHTPYVRSEGDLKRFLASLDHTIGALIASGVKPTALSSLGRVHS